MTFEISPFLGRSGSEILKFAKESTLAPQKRDKYFRLLAVDSVPKALRAELANTHVSWIERRNGTLHLEAPGLYVHDTEPRLDADDQSPDGDLKRPTRLRGLSGRCAEALLLESASLPNGGVVTTTPTQLASLAAVSAPQAGAVLRRLEVMGAMTADRDAKRARAYHLTRPELVLDAWTAEEDLDNTTTSSAYVWAPSFRKLLEQMQRLDESLSAWAVAGEAAANIYAPTLTVDPKVMAIWIPNTVPAANVVRALGGELVSEGANLTIRQTTGDPWARFRRPTKPVDAAGASHEEDHWHWLAPNVTTTIPGVESLPALWLISKPRALVEAARDGRGRSQEVANAARRSFMRIE